MLERSSKLIPIMNLTMFDRKDFKIPLLFSPKVLTVRVTVKFSSDGFIVDGNPSPVQFKKLIVEEYPDRPIYYASFFFFFVSIGWYVS